jgi:hypothetical protein
MSIQLDEIEQRLQTLIEGHLVKYLPRPEAQDQIAQCMAETLRKAISIQGIDPKGNTAPNGFLLVVHPSTFEQWQQDPRLMESLTDILRLATSEMGLIFSAAPSITLAAEQSMPVDGLEVRINNPASLTETQNMPSNTDDSSIRSAFLIVGGMNIYIIDKAVTNIGRRLDNHLVVDDPRISRYHAQIRCVRNRFIIFDLNSTGGTYVNGQRTTQSALYPGDVISLAGLPIVFGQDNPPTPISKGDTTPLSPASSERATIFLKSSLPKKDHTL